MELRYRELDALRGVAVLMMVLYHLLFDLSFFYEWDIPVHEGWWNLAAHMTASLFLLLVGICFMISWERTRNTQMHFLRTYMKYLRRGLTIFAGGMLISLATYFSTPEAYVKFGILHLIGVSALLQPFFTFFGIGNLIIGMMLLLLGLSLDNIMTASSLLFPLGITNASFTSIDYYPLLPWFGMVLLGMALGQQYYLPEPRQVLVLTGKFPYPPWLLSCGRHSLWIYFLHQPMLLLLLHIFLGPIP